MRKIIVTAFISLDGVMEAPGGEPGYRNSGWTFTDIEFVPEAYTVKGEEQEQAGALLLGRKSYEAFAPVWPDIPDFARYNEIPRYVVSSTLESEDERWPATILRNLDEVAALKETGDAPLLVHGSATLVHALADADLVDQYTLLVFPKLLGAGKRLFPASDVDATNLELTDSEAYSNGIVKLIYTVKR